MKTKNLVTLIVALILLVGLGFGVWWVVKNKDAIFGYMNDTSIYTQEEYDNHYQEGYDKGYQDANNNEEYYKTLIAQYEAQLAEKNAELEQYKIDKEKLTTERDNLQSQLDNANSELEKIQPTIEALEEEIANNEITIESLESEKSELELSLEEKVKELENVNSSLSQANGKIEELETEIAELEASNQDNIDRIAELQEEIDSLNEIKSQLESEKLSLTNSLTATQEELTEAQTLYKNLQQVNSANMTTISNLNDQILGLNTQITELNFQLENINSDTSSLNNKISELQQSIAFYEAYISQLESETEVMATFEYNGVVIDIQKYNLNSKVSFDGPEDTPYLILNGWQIDGVGEYVNFETFTIMKNTYFIANLTYKYDVKFMDDTTEYDSQIITKNDYAVEPVTDPVREGYIFEGWSLDGVNVVENINTTAVTSNTTYHAVWTKIHTVKFMEEDETLKTQEVKNGEYSIPPVVESTTNKVYNGWLVNGELVNPAEYKILADTVFVASVTYKYNVNFIVDDDNYESQLIVKNEFLTLPENPVKEGYNFLGWSLDGSTVINNINNIQVVENTTYIAVFKIKSITYNYYSDGKFFSYSIENWGELAPSIPEPKKEGYTFRGWSLDGENLYGTVAGEAMTENKNFYAVFEINTYTVTFKNGTETINTQNVEYNNYATLPEAPVKNGYVFKGWSLTENGEIVENINTLPITSNVTYYAIYIELTAGLYNESYEQVKTWENLISEKNITLTSTSNSITDVNEEITGILVLPSTITSIRNNAFSNSKLTEVILPDSLQKIEYAAFINSSLNKIEIPDSITELDSSTFKNCINLTSIFLGSGILTIDESTFEGCANIQEIVVKEGNKVYHSKSNCLIETETKTLILGSKNSIIPSDGSVTIINSQAFSGCSGIKSIIIPSEVTEIGFAAFSYCDNLYEVIFEEGSKITSINNNTFQNCVSLTNIILPDSVTTLGSSVFSGCSSITKLPFSSNSSIQSFGQNCFSNCLGLTNLELPCNITSLSLGAFSGCTNLEKVIFEEGIQIETIGASTFNGCTSLKEITIPNGVRSIGYYAFYGCNNLSTIYIPESVTSIDYQAFNNCLNLAIFTEFESKPIGWKFTNITPNYGYNYEEYLEIIGG